MAMSLLTSKEEYASWYVATTLPRHEKRSAEHLKMRGIEYFLPINTVPRQWKNRAPVVLNLPLFPGYIFIHADRARRFKALEVPGIRSFVVGVGKTPVTLPESEIQALRKGLSVRSAVSCSGLVAGQQVRISRGPFAGLSGAIQLQGDALVVVFNVTPIGQSIALEVNQDELEPLATRELFHGRDSINGRPQELKQYQQQQAHFDSSEIC